MRAQDSCPLWQAGVVPPGPPGGDVEHESWCLAGGGWAGPGDTEDEDTRIVPLVNTGSRIYTQHTED